jgi:hypothetical protein
MLMASIAEATQIVEGIGDKGEKPVDQGVFDVMVTFVQITQGLHITILVDTLTQKTCSIL